MMFQTERLHNRHLTVKTIFGHKAPSQDLSCPGGSDGRASACEPFRRGGGALLQHGCGRVACMFAAGWTEGSRPGKGGKSQSFQAS